MTSGEEEIQVFELEARMTTPSDPGIQHHYSARIYHKNKPQGDLEMRIGFIDLIPWSPFSTSEEQQTLRALDYWYLHQNGGG
jgi:hypothetical protein